MPSCVLAVELFTFTSLLAQKMKVNRNKHLFMVKIYYQHLQKIVNLTKKSFSIVIKEK